MLFSRSGFILSTDSGCDVWLQFGLGMLNSFFKVTQLRSSQLNIPFGVSQLKLELKNIAVWIPSPFLSLFLSLLFALSLLLFSLSLDRDRRPSSPGLANSRTLSRSHSRSPRAFSRRSISRWRSAHRSRTPLSRSLSRSRSLSWSLSRSCLGISGGSRFWGTMGWGTGFSSFCIGFKMPLWKSSYGGK